MIAAISAWSSRPLLAQPCILSFSLPFLSAGYLADLRSFDPAAMVWTLLSPGAGSGSPPSARAQHGFASAGGKLYVHGGAYKDSDGGGNDSVVASGRSM